MLKTILRNGLITLFAISTFSCTSTSAEAQVGSLIVTMTSPANGSTVSGTVPVSASVTIIGLLTVQSVQFQLDGNNLGAADTSSPYSVSWDTTTASNGSHTLTAVARNVLGLQFTSNPVTVTVSNGQAGDTTPPTVAIISPSGGQTVQATVTVSANASDNVGVAGVQFLLDGASLGAEDASAPYSVSWNTSTAGNGPHTLTAIARDAAGNSTTSTPVTVTVSNNAPPPPPSGRIEETDPSVSYSSGWNQGDSSSTWSGGTAAFSTSAGAQLNFAFTGPSVTWIGGRAPSTGIARISVDGVFLREVDTYSKTQEIRVPMFEAIDLANTSHTLTIDVTGRQNAAATGNAIFVDAFDVPAVTITRLQETDPDIAYSGPGVIPWEQGNTTRAFSAGIAALSSTAGARATLTFTGTGVTWIGAKGPQTGIANVFLDGALVAANVDTFSPTGEQIQAPLFSVSGLTETSHTLAVEVTGQQNPASTGPLIVVDAFEIINSGVRHPDTDPAIAYGPGWIQDNRDKAYSEGESAESNTIGAQATITFNGTGIRWIGARGPQTGIARVSVDGIFVEDLDTYATSEGPQHPDFFTSGLARGTHTLTVEVVGRNPLSTDMWVLIDAFDVIP